MPSVQCMCATRCESLAGCDSWRCMCGNQPHLDGFYPCDAQGKQVEPTPAAWPVALYRCATCGTIYQQDGQPTCREASPLSYRMYIPCGQPATKQVHWPDRKEGPVWMCDMCADHSIRNRRAQEVKAG